MEISKHFTMASQSRRCTAMNLGVSCAEPGTIFPLLLTATVTCIAQIGEDKVEITQTTILVHSLVAGMVSGIFHSHFVGHIFDISTAACHSLNLNH